MRLPFVSCIMPTANRLKFIPMALKCFLKQDYPYKELLIFDDGNILAESLIPSNSNIYYYYSKINQKIGPKRNFLCEKAKGEIIIHMDDDDWYASDWITKQVDSLITTGADITGLNNINYFSSELNIKWNYIELKNKKSWAYGGTLGYLKSFWEKFPFKNMITGEDNAFTSNPHAKICTHDYTIGYLGVIHGDNIGVKLFEDPKEKLQQEKWIMEINKPEKYEKSVSVFPDYDLPLVSCIMPTTVSRENFITSAINNFQNQDYPYKELVIIDDGKKSIKHLIPFDPHIKYYYFKPIGTIGAKRNIACEKSAGKFIAHWDDDDWYAPDWISYGVNALISSKADICGIDQVQFFSPSLGRYWMTKNKNSKSPWLTGASLIYKKSFWKEHQFKNLQSGEDNDYVRNTGAKIFAHDYFKGFIATLHSDNTSSTYLNELH